MILSYLRDLILYSTRNECCTTRNVQGFSLVFPLVFYWVFVEGKNHWFLLGFCQELLVF